MASNLYTKQPPLAGASTKVVLAERAYVAAADTIYADPAAKLDGASPGVGWADLGIVAGSAISLSYTKEVKYIETGIEKIRRGSYILSKTAQATFTLEQYDMPVLEEISGLTPSAVGAIGNKIHIGQDDIIEKAFLFVGTNKVDGKEYHTYCKKGALVWSLEQEDDSRVIKVSADLYAFTPAGETEEAYYTLIVLD